MSSPSRVSPCCRAFCAHLGSRGKHRDHAYFCRAAPAYGLQSRTGPKDRRDGEEVRRAVSEEDKRRSVTSYWSGATMDGTADYRPVCIHQRFRCASIALALEI